MPSSHANEEQRVEEHQAAPAAEAEQREDAAVAELEQRNAELEDRHRRARADLENYRKRSERDLDQRVTAARDAVIGEWLEAVDSVERALAALGGDDPAAAGLRAVLEQMESILAREGVARIGAEGEPFDPERHEAVDVVDTDERPDRTIAAVRRSGFGRNGRVLRPALVAVSRAGGP